MSASFRADPKRIYSLWNKLSKYEPLQNFEREVLFEINRCLLWSAAEREFDLPRGTFSVLSARGFFMDQIEKNMLLSIFKDQVNLPVSEDLL